MAKKWNWNYTQVLYLSNGTYMFGSIEKGKVNLLKKFNKLSDAKAELNLVDTKKWLRMRSLPLDHDKAMYDIIHCRDYWIVSPPVEPSDKEWEKHWWSFINEKCIKCIMGCKESGFVQILACPNFKKDKHKDE